MLENTDIRKISKVEVEGFILNNEEEYELDINVSGIMVLPCARTLKDVNRTFNIKINEIIDENDDTIIESP